MQTFNIHEAKTQLSRLLEQVSRGKAFIIAKAGHPIAKVVPIDAPDSDAQHRIGFLAGEILVPDDFDRMGNQEIAQLFYSNDEPAT